MKKLSLRLRLIIFFTIISCIVWSVAAVLSWKETRENIDEFFDTYQLALGRQLAAADWQNISPESQKITDKIIKNIYNSEDDDDTIGFAVFNLQGQMVFHDNENGKNFAYSPTTGMFSKENIDGDVWRIVRIPSADTKYIIAVGQELDYRDDIVSDMVEEFMLPWLIGLILLLVSIIIMISTEFLPLKKLTQKLKTRNPDDLSPLETTKIPTEILPLIEAMNYLLQQAEAMITRERSFISDSAHELRSPLTALKVQLEIAQMSEDDPQTRASALKKLELGIERSSRLVEQLLALSKIESSFAKQSNVNEVIDWKGTACQIIEEYIPEAEQKHITITSHLSNEGPAANGNPVLCALLLRNLIDNAVKYSPDNARITVYVQGGKLEVINSETKVNQDILSRLSERFFRPAGQKQAGSGLGLAIAERIARFHNCRLAFENKEEGFSVSLLPL